MGGGIMYRPGVNFLYMGLFLTLRKIGYVKLTYPARAAVRQADGRATRPPLRRMR
jgi:hypothetical protein